MGEPTDDMFDLVAFMERQIEAFLSAAAARRERAARAVAEERALDEFAAAFRDATNADSWDVPVIDMQGEPLTPERLRAAIDRLIERQPEPAVMLVDPKWRRPVERLAMGWRAVPLGRAKLRRRRIRARLDRRGW